MKIKEKKFIHKLFVAVLAFSQAVFLLLPILISAQTYKISSDLPAEANIEFIYPPTAAVQKIITLTVKTAIPVENVHILYKPNISGIDYKYLGTAIKQDNTGAATSTLISNTYILNYDTRLAGNGAYKLKAQTASSGITYSSAEISITVFNPIEVNILNSPGSIVSGEVNLSVKVSNLVERVEFYYKLSNNTTNEHILLGFGVKDTANNLLYNYKWNTNATSNLIKNGSYIITAKAIAGGDYFWSREVNININNSYEVGIISPANNSKQTGSINLSANTSIPSGFLIGDTLKFKIYNSNNELIKNISSVYSDNVYSVIFNTKEFNNGKYKIFAEAKIINYDGVIAEHKSIDIYFDIENITDYTVHFVSPLDNSTVSGENNIKISTTIEVDILFINIWKIGAAFPVKELATNHISGTKEYSAVLNTKELLDGLYIIKVKSLLLKNPIGYKEKISSINFIIKNNILPDDNIIATTPNPQPIDNTENNLPQITATSSTILPIIKPPAPSVILKYPKENQIINNSIELLSLSNGPVNQVEFILMGDGFEVKRIGKLRNTNEWFYLINTALMKDGYYSIKAIGWDINKNKIESKAVKINVKNYFEKAIENSQIIPIQNQESADTDNIQTNNNADQEQVINEPIVPSSPGANIESDKIKTPDILKTPSNRAIINDQCSKFEIYSEEECNKFLEEKYLTKECREAGIKTRLECDKHAYSEYAGKNCLSLGISNKEECRNFLSNKYADKMQCEKDNNGFCKEAVKEKYLGDIVIKQQKFDELKKNTLDLAVRPTTIKELESSLILSKDIIPLMQKETEIGIVAVKSEIIIDKSDNLIQTAPIAITIDRDKDGLSDDTEKRIGTNPDNFDTDNDGFSDGNEVKNNYNPLGDGKLREKLAPIDEAIIQNKTIEQPKTTGQITDDFKVDMIANMDNKDKTKNNYLISGQAIPNTVFTLYIYSDLPVITTVKTDEYGNWNYEFNKTLIDGEHEIYIALNDNTGKILNKSEPLNFFIKEAKAVSVKDFISVKAINQPAESEKMLNVYMYFAFAAIIFGILAFVTFLLLKRKNREFKF